ncbi:related to UPC2 - regulatory protein involved in control of sterol uptake [Fusarium torulosum]|uniref:Related to UPC2 - regulatory protein involved in control of sterol uptake n=1 Tax=Fusarium torulosum TaxID=33205 RepID=A0AAE8SP85_9HYPO|nr:related to UPC2 - regulatory protein involved in control of sterol uptake [Fusarium torulosum]
MPPRRSHKKSRAGCQRCKKRKIKCDEVHPRCGNCAKHGVLCDFSNPDVLEELAVLTDTSTESIGAPIPSLAPTINFNSGPRTPLTRLRAPSSPARPPRPNPSPPTSVYSQPSISSSTHTIDHGTDHGKRMLELRLMHHYTNITSKTLLTNSPTAEDIWQRAVPQMAFSSNGKTYLADAILSVAALHLRSISPNDKTLVRASHAYSASSLSAFGASLGSGITPDNAEALFLTATLIAFQASASRIFVKDDGDAAPGDSTSQYVPPLSWFHAFQGIKTVVANSWQWIHHSDIVKIVIDSQPGFQLDLNSRSPDSFFGHMLKGLREELLNEDPRLVPSTTQAYLHAVSVLNWAHKNYHAAAALTFPATISKRYVDLVDARRPRALAILACFFALLKRMDNVWWLQDVARREVMGLVSLFEPGSKWWCHLEWPIRIAMLDGNSIPEDIWGTELEEQAPEQQDVGSRTQNIEIFAEMLHQHTQPPIPIADEHFVVPDSPD